MDAAPLSFAQELERKERTLARRQAFTIALSLASVATGCGGGVIEGMAPLAPAAPAGAAPAAAGAPDGAVTGGATPGGAVTGGATPGGAANGGAVPDGGGGAAPASFRGDDSQMPSFGGWSRGGLPVDAVARAGFDWFETGYPGDARANEVLTSAGVRPFAYINLAEVEDALWGASGYSGAILRTSAASPTLHLVDVTDLSWQDWLVRRADQAYAAGSRGIKWDAASPDVPPGKSRADVNDALASVMQRVRGQHPDLKFIFNQGFEFAAAYPQFIDGMETEGLFSSTFPGAYLAPWNDPFYWGPQFQQMKALQQRGVRVFVAEYADPFGDRARDLCDAIIAQGFVPYVTSPRWDARGRGYHVAPGW
jgi:hypothetical protein